MNTATSLEQLTALSTRSFSSHEEAVDTILQTVGEFMGMRTSFLSSISRHENRLTLLRTHTSEGGFALTTGMQLPLSRTFCEMIANAPILAPLVLEDVHHN